MVQTIPGKSDISKETKKKEAAINSGALHGKFTAVAYRGFYRGKAYHGYTVVASYHIPYRLKPYNLQETVPFLPYIPFCTVVFAENRINMYHIPF